MFFVRWLLGRIILLINALIPVRGRITRPPVEQTLVDEACASLALYQYEACPFCVKVRRNLRKNGLDIELRDARRVPEHRAALSGEGGKQQVPCLRIRETDGSVQWLYESAAIIEYLEQRFAPMPTDPLIST